MRTRILGKWPWLCGLPAVLLLAAGYGAAQSTGVGPLSQEGARDAGLSNQPAPSPIPLPPEEAKDLYGDNNASQANNWMLRAYLAQEMQMVKDSHKLVALAAKLNAEVASQHGSPLTPAERKEVAQIEKLARSVRTKMEAPVPRGAFPPDLPGTAAFSPR